MAQVTYTPIQVNTPIHDYHDREVDNNSFFEVMEKELPLILSSTEIHQQARLDLQTLLVDMKTKNFIQGTTQWTALEQKNFFMTIRQEIINAWIAANLYIKEKIKPLIEDEIWREINGEEVKKDNSYGTTEDLPITSAEELHRSLDISSLFTKEASVIPLDLRLTIGRTETTEDAKKKLARYHGKYNALILVDEEGHPIGIITHEILQKYTEIKNTMIESVDYIQNTFWYLNTSGEDIKKIMQQSWINILPIIDSKTGVLIGILTDTAIANKELRYYSTTSLTELSLDYLRTNG